MASVAAQNYAEALFVLGLEEDLLEPFKHELEDIQTVFASSDELRIVMSHPKISMDEKKNVLEKLFADANTYILHYMYLLVDKGRFNCFEESIDAFKARYNEYFHIAVCKVESASALSEEQKQSIKEVMEKRTHKKIVLECKVNPDLLIGIRASVDEIVLDNSALTKMETMKQSVLQAAY